MIQESEKPYRTVKEKLSRGGIVLIMSTTSLKRQVAFDGRSKNKVNIKVFDQFLA